MARLLLISICFIFSSCTSLLYYPNTDRQYFKPEQVSLTQEDVWLNLDDGKKIHAWWFKAQKDGKEIKSKGSFLFFHGNAENLTSHFVSLSWLPPEGYSYLIFDYPGYGKSEGKPTPKDNVEAAKKALEWIAKKDPNAPIFIYGQSMGGIIAMTTALEMKDTIPLKAVIIDASFLSFTRIARHKLAQHWFTWPLQLIPYVVLSDKYAPEDIGRLSPTPLLIIHGQQDGIVEPRWGEEIYEQAKEPKEIWRIPDGFHNSTFWQHDRQYRAKVLEWVNKVNSKGARP